MRPAGCYCERYVKQQNETSRTHIVLALTSHEIGLITCRRIFCFFSIQMVDEIHFARSLLYFLLTARKAMWHIIGCVCLSVSLSVRQQLSNTLTYEVHMHIRCTSLRVKFVYEGHRVNETRARKVENPYFRNVKLRSAISPDSPVL